MCNPSLRALTVLTFFCMSLPLPPPPPSHTASPKGFVPAGKKEQDIVVIPDKFYGVALKLNALTDAESQSLPKIVPPPPRPPPVVPSVAPMSKHPVLPIVLVMVVLFSGVAGGFVYFNRDLLFKKTPSNPPAMLVIIPDAPKDLIGALTGTASASLSWTIGSGNETGFRIQRKEGEGTFVSLTSLPSQSVNFLDTTPTPGRAFSYRVLAVNEGGESQPSNEVTITIPDAVPLPPPAPTLPAGGLDSDSDGLSDPEELVFGTDPHQPDTDRDGFLDGNEAFHLYNPGAKAPVNLVDSGLISRVDSPSGWSLFVPKQWKIVFDPQEGPGAVIDTNHGEKFQIALENNPQRVALLDWYLAGHPGTISSAVRSITTKKGLEGILSPDRLDAYFAWDDRIWVIHYDLGGQSFINYRTLFEMILNSLRLVGAPIVKAPTMDTLPGPGALVGDTSSTVIGVPESFVTSTISQTSSTQFIMLPSESTSTVVTTSTPFLSATTSTNP